MEQLNKLKDAKIDSLMRKLDEGIGLWLKLSQKLYDLICKYLFIFYFTKIDNCCLNSNFNNIR